MNDDFDIIALNGITGECITTTDQDDWCQRFKENPADLQDAIRQEHEGFLAELEALAVEALVTGNWDEVFTHINQVRSAKVDLSNCFQSQEEHGEVIAFIQRLLGEASTKDLPRPGADSFSHPQN